MKHRVHAAHHTHRVGSRWVWWADCGHCGVTECWDTWELACWYLELHVRIHHEVSDGA